ncbi:MAG TPA: ArsA family ATPase, partial [Longimicrobiales bacterium]|nr:ArsA family ATPase [Longimicrobiales bacterium]
LREWRKRISKKTTATSPAKRADPHGRKAEPWLARLEPRYIWVAGKGGVGKSTCACALATLNAESRNTCVVSTDPAGSLSDVFGMRVGPEAREITTRLFARQIDASGEFERMRSQYREAVNEVFASFGLNEAAHLDRKVLESLWDFAPPGIDEIVSLIEIVEQAGEFDTLIIDSAPTGHFLRLIQLPELALDWVHSLMRLIIKYGAAGSLDALARDLLAFAKRLRQLHTDLSTPGTSAVFVVTLDEPMVHAETERLSSSLKQAAVPVAATILNRADSYARVDGRWIMTPDLPDEVVGPPALRQFIAQWTLHGE